MGEHCVHFLQFVTKSQQAAHVLTEGDSDNVHVHMLDNTVRGVTTFTATCVKWSLLMCE